VERGIVDRMARAQAARMDRRGAAGLLAVGTAVGMGMSAALDGAGAKGRKRKRHGCGKTAVIAGPDAAANGAALQAAVDAAAPGGTVQIGAGEYRVSLDVLKPLTVKRCGKGVATLRSQDEVNWSIAVVAAGAVAFEGLAVTTGFPEAEASGGIDIRAGDGPLTATFTDCTITGNRASGIRVDGATLVLAGATAVTDNTGLGDGGGIVAARSTVILRDSALVSGNTAGAIAAPEPEPSWRPGHGGGILFDGVLGRDALVIRDAAAVRGNVAANLPAAGGSPGEPGDGGGIALLGGTLDLRAAGPGAGSENVARDAAGGTSDQGQVGGIWAEYPESGNLEVLGADAVRVSGNVPADCSAGLCG